MGIEDLENGETIEIPTTRLEAMEKELMDLRRLELWLESRHQDIVDEYNKYAGKKI